MKKIFKSISASVTAFIIASTMVVSASAASSADVVSAAKSAGVPSNHVSELKNYLDSHASKFSSADYDYMVKALSDCGEMRLPHQEQQPESCGHGPLGIEGAGFGGKETAL